MIPYNWTQEEESEVNKILQLIAVANISLYIQPTIPDNKQKEILKSAFSKMVGAMLQRILKGGE